MGVSHDQPRGTVAAPGLPGGWALAAGRGNATAGAGVNGSLFSIAKGTPWPVVVFLLSLMLPNEAGFRIGTLQLFPYRLVLICAFVPCLLRVLSLQSGPLRLCDGLLAFFGPWMVLALASHHGLENGLESGGILVAESLGAFLIARAYITNLRAFLGTVALLTVAVVGMAAFTIPEALTGRHLIREACGALFGSPQLGRIPDPRFGLQRAFGPFNHPIHYGVFCASMVGLSFYALSTRDRKPIAKWARAAAITVSAFMSVSSGAMAAAMFQFLLIGWDRAFRSVRQRWVVFFVLAAVAWFMVDAVSNRGPMRVALSYLTFSPATAYNRILIWEYGSAEVARNPVFGIGFNDWARPEWMHSGSMDNFWLVIAVQFGLPAVLALIGAVVWLMLWLATVRDGDPQLAGCRMGWIVSVAGMSIAGATVHFWGVPYSFFFFVLGAGVWLLARSSRSGPDAANGAARAGVPAGYGWRT